MCMQSGIDEVLLFIAQCPKLIELFNTGGDVFSSNVVKLTAGLPGGEFIAIDYIPRCPGAVQCSPQVLASVLCMSEG